MYAPPANVAGQIAGLGIGAMGLSKFMAEGGMADGGSSVEDPQNIQEIVGKLSDAQLDQALKAAMQRGDAMEIDAIKQEQAMRASERNGLASTVTPQMTEDMMPSAANGGIVAFADNPDQPVSEDMPKTEPLPEAETSRFGEFLKTIRPSQDQDLIDKIKKQEVQYKQNVYLSDALDAKPGLFEKTTLSERQKREKTKELAQKAVSSVGQESTYTPLTKAALDEKIRASTGDKGLPQKPPPFADSDASERADRMTGNLITGGGKKKSISDTLAVSQAAENVAQNVGVQEQPLEDRAMSIYKKFKEMSKAELQSLNDAIEGKKGDADKIKAKGLSEALMQFGFGMAANASKPGAKFFGSAAGAAPILGQVASENEKLQRAASDNYMKLKMDQTRYQVALDKGDMQAATSLAAQIRQGDMQQKQLDALVDYHNKQLQVERQKLGVTAAAYAPQAIREAEMLMARTPGMTFQDAYKQATRGRDASENAAGARDRAALAKGLLDLNKEHKKESMMYPANSKEAKNMLNRHEIEKKLLHESLGFQYGGAGGGGGATLNPDLFQIKPVKQGG